MINVFTIYADIKLKMLIDEPTVVQNDNIRFIINVFDNRQPLDLTNVKTVSLASVRLDGQTIVTPGTKIDKNIVQFDLGTEETKVPGRVEATAQFYDSEGRVSTISFSYRVVKDPTGDGYIPSEREQTLIETVLNDGPLVIQQAKDAAKYATAQGQYAKQVADESKTRWLNPVETFADIATTYPNPRHGDTVQTTSDGKIYRYENGKWNWTQAYTDTALADAQNKIGILSTADDVLFQNDRSIFLEIDKYKKLRFQQGVATITGVNSNGYFRDNEPFVQVTLTGYTQINAPNYAVVIDVISSNGDYGQLIVYDKTQNGFKVKMTGSASSVTFIWTLLNPLVA